MNTQQCKIAGRLVYDALPKGENTVRLFSTNNKLKHYLGRAKLDEKGNFTLTTYASKIGMDKATNLPAIEARFHFGGMRYHVPRLTLKETDKYAYAGEVQLSKEIMSRGRTKFKQLGLKIESMKDFATYEKDFQLLMREVPNGGNLFSIAPSRFLKENGIDISDKALAELRKISKTVGPEPTRKYELIAKGTKPKTRINF